MSIDPDWADISFGVFICIDCSGIHRSLGVHISKVKSIGLDQWTEENVQVLQHTHTHTHTHTHKLFFFLGKREMSLV